MSILHHTPPPPVIRNPKLGVRLWGFLIHVATDLGSIRNGLEPIWKALGSSWKDSGFNWNGLGSNVKALNQERAVFRKTKVCFSDFSVCLRNLRKFDNKCTIFIQRPIKFGPAERDSHFLSASFLTAGEGVPPPQAPPQSPPSPIPPPPHTHNHHP